jgi:hypothetical protein
MSVKPAPSRADRPSCVQSVGQTRPPAPAAQTLPRISPRTGSSWQTCPKANARSHVPTWRPPSPDVRVPPGWTRSAAAPRRQCSPRRDHGVDQGKQLRPGRAATGRSPRSTSWSAPCSITSRSVSVAGSSSPAPATKRSSSNERDIDLVQHQYARMTSKGVLRTRASCPPGSRHPPWSEGPFIITPLPAPTQSQGSGSTLRRDYPRSATPPCAASRARRLCAAWRAAWATT